MKIRQIMGFQLLATNTRQRLESETFVSLDTAAIGIKRHFPNHIVQNEAGQISVMNRDRTFQVAAFQEI